MIDECERKIMLLKEVLVFRKGGSVSPIISLFFQPGNLCMSHSTPLKPR